VKELERKLGNNLNLRKSLMCTLLIAIAFSAIINSIAYARETPPEQTPQNTPAVMPEENPILIATQDNATIGLNDAPTVDRTQDNSQIVPDDSKPLDSVQEVQAEDDQLLIAPQAQPDTSATNFGIIAIIAAIAVGGIVLVLLNRKKN